jgi:TonB-dependent receptor
MQDQQQYNSNDMFYGGGQQTRTFIANNFPEYGFSPTTNRLWLTPMLSDYSRSNFLNGRFDLGPTADINQMTAILDAVDGAGIYMLLNGTGSLGRDYNGYERFLGYYAMAEFKIGKYVTIMPGYRIEEEFSRYTAKFVRGAENAVNQYPPNFDTTAVRRATWVLPMHHLRIKPTEWLDLRLAYTETLTRPDYMMYAPITYLNFQGSSINTGNPNLRSAKSTNWDASVSIYQKYVGFFTASYFTKNIEGMFWNVSFPFLPGQTIRPDLTLPAGFTQTPTVYTAANNKHRAYQEGIELDWQTNFWYLPQLLKGLILNVNMTWITSNTSFQNYRIERVRIPDAVRPPFYRNVIKEDTTKGSMPDTPPRITNVTLGYDYKGFSIRTSYFHQAGTLSGAQGLEAINNRYNRSFRRFDVSIKQKITKNVQVFCNLNNLNNQADRSYQWQPGFPTYEQFFGPVYDFGVRVKLK